MNQCTHCKQQLNMIDFNIHHKHKLTQKIYYKSYCKACEKKRKHIYYKKNKNHIIAKTHQWQMNNPKRTKEIYRNKERRRRKTIHGKLHIMMTGGIYRSLNGNKNSISWTHYVDYTIDELKEHLELYFDDKMTWDNYGSYWEVDHIIPKASFNITSPYCKDFKMCWFLLNLQPLSKKENRSKGDRLFDGSLGRHKLVKDIV